MNVFLLPISTLPSDPRGVVRFWPLLVLQWVEWHLCQITEGVIRGAALYPSGPQTGVH